MVFVRCSIGGPDRATRGADRAAGGVVRTGPAFGKWVVIPAIERATMYNASEHFAEFNQANVSNAIKLASFSIENAEKLVSLNINAAKMALAQAIEGAQAAASVKDVQELVELRTKLAE